MNQKQQVKQSQSKKIELVIQQLNSLPTLPAVAARLLQITVRSDTQAKEVVQLIESDPSLASRIITLATRAHTGINKKTASLSKTVVLLGFDAVRNAVLSIKVFEALQRQYSQDNQEVFDRIGFWKHSLAVACASKMLISHIDPKIDPEEAFVCGLLHDIGKLALDTCLPKSFARVVQITESSMTNIADIERKILGLDHTVIGRRLALKWNLPQSITETVWLHHQWIKGLPDAVQNPGIVQTVHLADLLARQMRLGYSGNHQLHDTAEAVAEELGCPASILEQISRQLPEAISERASMLGLDDIEPDELYHDALSEANSELGRVNDRLRRQNDKLAQRSRYFDLFCQLDQSLRTGQSVVDICSILAALWYCHLDCRCCGVYVGAKDHLIIEGAVKIESEAEPSVFIVDRTDDPDVDPGSTFTDQWATAGFAVTPVNTSHAWFFEQVAPMFEIGHTVMMPLRTGEDIIGAILWQTDQPLSFYQNNLKEMQAFAAGAALALQQAQKQEQQSIFCEQLAQSNAELQKAQKELLQKRSLATVGEMACGAAHEVNNPLAVVVGRSQLLASSETDPQRKEILDMIAQNGREISQIITDLLEFAQPTQPNPGVINPTDLISEAALAQIEVNTTEGIQLEYEFEPDLPDLYVDADQIRLALKEIIANAIESYSDQTGTVTLTLHYDELEEMVVLDVSDQGTGMDEETLRKATHPFFSAKTAGRQRGLGLSRSIRHIESNGGKLNLESQPGQGTTVRVHLPPARHIPTEDTVLSESVP